MHGRRRHPRHVRVRPGVDGRALLTYGPGGTMLAEFILYTMHLIDYIDSLSRLREPYMLANHAKLSIFLCTSRERKILNTGLDLQPLAKGFDGGAWNDEKSERSSWGAAPLKISGNGQGA